jgi:formylglycine-generating enzyme
MRGAIGLCLALPACGCNAILGLGEPKDRVVDAGQGGSTGGSDGSVGGTGGTGGIGGAAGGADSGRTGGIGGAAGGADSGRIGGSGGVDAGDADAVADTGVEASCTAETDAAFCTRLGKNCGNVTAANNCGTQRTVSCGACSGATPTCSSTNVCCAPETDTVFCSRLGKNCGAVTMLDNCSTSRTVASCGPCPSPKICGASNVCDCVAETDATFCTRLGKNCGNPTGSDNCGATRTTVSSCGTCTAPLTCSGGGTANVCGCTPETDTAFCARLGKNCGNVTAANNCGTSRTVSCGTCTAPNTCAGGGTANACACPPETDAAICSRLGKVCGPATATDNCSTSRTVASCGPCSGAADQCVEGACRGRQCAGLPATCGATGNVSCCSSSNVQDGPTNPGLVYRSYDGVSYMVQTNPAWVHTFNLDTYEVTVGRFRAFAAGYPANLPATGAGKNPNDASDPGWASAWNTNNMAANAAALVSSANCNGNSPNWTPTPGANDLRPMNCLTWYVALAFCIWDGGRLPTEAEWNFAAAGAGEAREYPWATLGVSIIDSTYAVYDATGAVANVGSQSTNGDGRWGQADMAGNLWEWALDWYQDSYPNPCNDCAVTATPDSGTPKRVLRGGSFRQSAAMAKTSFRYAITAASAYDDVGVRCARAGQ